MESVSLETLNRNVLDLQKMIKQMNEVIMEDSLELSDEVVAEIERSRNAPESDFISQEDVEAEFLA